MLKELLQQNSWIPEANINPHTEQVFAYASQFISDEQYLLGALLFCIENGFAKTQIQAPQSTQSLINELESLISLETPTINSALSKSAAIIYLSILKVSFDQKKIDFLSKERIHHGLKTLELMDISELRSDLEDVFFSYLEPQIYEHYQGLLQFTKEQHKQKEVQITQKLKAYIEEINITPEIKSRLKSIFSIHKKVVSKKILYSQVLDTIGLRIVVENENQCYEIMGLILKLWPVISNKIKDYIAVPKSNGYQSIHLTIMDQDQPVEIQIRTKKMDSAAQFGKANHLEYKLSRANN